METINSSLTRETTGIIVHGVNCQGVMGAGLALQLKNLYPIIYTDYKKAFLSKPTPVELLGTIALSYINKDLIVVSAFTQLYYGRDKNTRYVSYDAIENSFNKLNALATETKLPVKFGTIGAGLGGGNWNVIRTIIEETLSKEIVKQLFVYVK